MLGAGDQLPVRPGRVIVAGTSGAGKSTLARRIATVLEVPYFEIDALFHGPDWTPRATFLADVDARIAQPQWVTEWQYDSARERLAARAELLVWLDLPRATVMCRVVRRTVRRSLTGTELWNGNREAPLRTFTSDRDHIVRWAWRTHGEMPARVRGCLVRRPELVAVRLRRPREVVDWLAGPLAGSA